MKDLFHLKLFQSVAFAFYGLWLLYFKHEVQQDVSAHEGAWRSSQTVKQQSGSFLKNNWASQQQQKTTEEKCTMQEIFIVKETNFN